MRLRAIYSEEARKPYPIAILIDVVGVLLVPGVFLAFRYGLELTTPWMTAISIGLGLVLCCVMIGLGSIVEDVHDIMTHTIGYVVEEDEALSETDLTAAYEGYADALGEEAEYAEEAEDSGDGQPDPEGEAPEA